MRVGMEEQLLLIARCARMADELARLRRAFLGLKLDAVLGSSSSCSSDQWSQWHHHGH